MSYPRAPSTGKNSRSRKSAHPGTPRPSLRSEEFVTKRKSNAHLSKATNLPRQIQRESQKFAGDSNKPKELVVPENRRNNFNSPESLPNFLLWAKNEPFDFGIVSPNPCPKIGINILRKIAEYCRDKPGHYPELSLTQWCHICKYKLQWNDPDFCAVYFRVFDILSRQCEDWARRTSRKEKGGLKEEDGQWTTLDEKFYKRVKQGNLPDTEIKETFKVHTLQFLLFLYLQHFRRLYKKFMVLPSTFKQDESWPKIWKNELGSSSISRNSSSSGSSGSNIPEIQHAEFLSAGLEEIIEFLMILSDKAIKTKASYNNVNEYGDQIDEDAKLNQNNISVDIMRALSFLIGAASTSLEKEFKTLDGCLLLPAVAGYLEYNRIERTVNKHCLIEWIRCHLKINPWGPSCISIPQVPLSVMTGVYDKDGESAKKNRIFWNTQNFPKAWFLISGIEKQVLHLDSLEPMSSIKIHRCIDAHIYLPGTHQTILIQKCHGVIITLGVVSKIVKVSDCSGITVSAVGRLFLIYDVHSCVLNLLTPSSPIICGNKNRDIKLAPYNTSYPDLENHMEKAGITSSFQQWSKPFEMASDGNPLDDRKGQQSNVSLLSPDNFMTALFPFRISSSFISHPPFPSEHIFIPYQRRLESATERVEQARTEFKEKMLASDEDINLIYQITLHRFKKWLKETGNFDLIVGLCSLQKSLQQKSSTPLMCSKGHGLTCIPKSLKNFFCGAAGLNLFSEKTKRNQGKQTLALDVSDANYFGVGPVYKNTNGR